MKAKLATKLDQLFRAIYVGDYGALNSAIFVAHIAFFPVILLQIAVALEQQAGWRLHRYPGESIAVYVWTVSIALMITTGLSEKKLGCSQSRLIKWSRFPFAFITLISSAALGVFIIPFIVFAAFIVGIVSYGPFGMPFGYWQAGITIIFLTWYVSIDGEPDDVGETLNNDADR
ncbi:MAG: hypothetical protein AAFQ58_00415 [Pseudomonadota bacterium]